MQVDDQIEFPQKASVKNEGILDANFSHEFNDEATVLRNRF